MKKFLFLSATMATFMAGAAPLQSSPQQLSAMDVASEVSVKTVSLRKGGNVRKLKSIDKTVGLAKTMPLQKNLPIGARKAKAASALPEGIVFQESFEGWDGETLPWAPEGWTIESKSSSSSGWEPDGALSGYGIYPADGETMMAISYDIDSKSQDEWLISPSFTVEENNELKFYAYIHPMWLFNMDDFDWDNYDFVGEREVICTMKILVKEDGATDWTEIWDASTEWLDVPAKDVLNSGPAGLQEYVIPMNDYAGKTINIAFQYVGKDGDTMFLDMVSVGLPSLEGVKYDDPLEMLYFGMSEEFISLGSSIAVMPADAEITWTNLSDIPQASFEWQYDDPATAELTTGEGDELTLRYLSKYTEGATHMQWFNSPKLYASAPGTTAVTYENKYEFQAGGKPEITVDGVTESYGLSPMSVAEHGYGIVTKDAEFGQPSTPIFGYDSNTDAWWLNYTYNGDLSEVFETDHVYVHGIANRLITGSSPMVIDGIRAFAYGQISADAEFTMEIIELDDLSAPILDSPVATAKLKGSEVTVVEAGMQNHLILNFKFETPFVLEPGDSDHLIMLTGFHDPENVTYFAPRQSLLQFNHSKIIAWIWKEIKIQGAEDYRSSFTPLFQYESEYGMCHNAFCFNLDAYYPWLQSAATEVAIYDDGTPVEVALNSYYDGKDLTIEAPAGVVATVEGRYDNCKLVLSHDNTDVIAEGKLTISAPGVKQEIDITEQSGINTVVGDKVAGATPVAAYTVTGQPVTLDQAVEGVYIVKYSDGSVAKVAVK